MPQTNSEIRTIRFPCEIRMADESAEGVKCEGYGLKWDEDGEPWPDYIERFQRGVFSKWLKTNPNIQLLINHDGLALASTKAGYMEVREDKKGIYFSADLDPTDPEAASVIAKLKRGNVDKMSIRFRAQAYEWIEPKQKGDPIIRIITEAELYEISFVAFPAYDSSEVEARAQQSAETIKEYHALKDEGVDEDSARAADDRAADLRSIQLSGLAALTDMEDLS